MPMPKTKPAATPVKTFFPVHEIIEQLTPYFVTINGRLAEAINHELIKISIVNIKRTPKYLLAAKSKDKVNKFRQAAIDSLERQLKKDSSYLSEFRGFKK